MFECCVCKDNVVDIRKVPKQCSGCPCSIQICLDCFLTDYNNRAHAHTLRKNGQTVRWKDMATMKYEVQRMCLDFKNSPMDRPYTTQEDFNKGLDEYITDKTWFGRTCPICRVLVLWKNRPKYDENTQTLTCTESRIFNT